jgi:hypothetical protein
VRHRHPRNRLIGARASPGLALITSAIGPAGSFTGATGTQFRAGERTAVTGLFIWLRIDDQRQRSFVTV